MAVQLKRRGSRTHSETVRPVQHYRWALPGQMGAVSLWQNCSLSLLSRTGNLKDEGNISYLYSLYKSLLLSYA